MCGSILLDIRLLVCHNSPVGNYGIKSDHRKGVRQPARDGKVQKRCARPRQQPVTGTKVATQHSAGGPTPLADAGSGPETEDHMSAKALHPLAREAIHGRRLDGADLKEANLDGATLAGASLTGATLAGASLVGAVLTGANLTGADLTGADLTKADLRNAILSGANLTGALCIEADLRGVTASSTNLTDADFEDAKVDGSWLWHDWRVEGGLAHQKSDDERDGGCPFCGRIDQNDRDHCPHFVASLYCDTTYQPVKAEDLGWPNFPPTFTPDDLSDTLVQQHLGDLSSLLCHYSKTDNAGWITVDDYQLSRDIYALVTPPLVSVMRTGHLDQWEMLYCPDHEDLGELHDILSRLTEGLAAVLEESPEFALAIEGGH